MTCNWAKLTRFKKATLTGRFFVTMVEWFLVINIVVPPWGFEPQF